MLSDDNKHLKQEIENLKQQLMEKATVDEGNVLLHIPRVDLNQLNDILNNNAFSLIKLQSEHMQTDLLNRNQF
ncbi:unnamed protein product [Adineta steineri]|uniref:Uncharacterized protein n=1 Tax=Adineta steineri TaxID=433720 RepID=A0A815IWC1_9BILA|nr:unnamed protein product [Adineta steineri]CAF4137418.1 unnamed protein product [Adineta steineri]